MADESAGISRETLVAWKKGDQKAFEEIVRATMKKAYAMALGLVGNVEDARDLSQEAFMAAHRARGSFDADRPFFPWFYRILRNRCLNFIRTRSKRGEISMDVLVEKEFGGPRPDTIVINREDSNALWKALFGLSEEHREIIVLRNFQGLSYRELSEALDISEGTVMSRLFYARKALYDALKDRFENGGKEKVG